MRHPSWTFSQVCREWRTAVQGHPRCWSHVVLSLDKLENSLRLSLLFAAVMDNAGKQGIFIWIDSPKAIPSNLMSGILHSCCLWREATLSLTLWDFKALSEMKHSF
ncbi:hypothetical protein CPB85DRAFT_1342839, partial [Mucidula mucida]